ncbi:hypothetical protein HU200_002793 [Digitaria exilis]|uniref:UspA domain-containing protein n=1 Tax=Digitaria exilis TaxID=1010633 RepID=A0A835KKY1_9POAL|nr:hypothetical protein HU200_011949 [Digitaria exilis]KAF8779120.1 hypothetical protein HU200_002793 [Digitaria exilis]
MAEIEAASAQHLDGGHGDVVEDDAAAGQPSHSNGGGATWEIEELEPDPETTTRQAGSGGGGVSSVGGGGGGVEDVYVAVGKGGSSMAALSWALRRLTRPRSFIYLVHVFPVVNSIPTRCERSLLLFNYHICFSFTMTDTI